MKTRTVALFLATAFLAARSPAADDPAAVKQLEQAGCTIEKDEGGRVKSVSFQFAKGVRTSDLDLLKTFEGLTELSLYDKPATDAVIAGVAGLPRLKKLYLGSTKVTDAGLKHLAGLGSVW